MHRALAASAALLCVVSIGWRSFPTAAPAPTRSFVWLSGEDTIGRESFTRNGDVLTGDMMGAAWRPATYEVHLSPAGGVSTFDARISRGAGQRRLSVVLRPDTALIIEHSDRYEDTVRIASRPNAIPMLSSPVALFELVIQRARAAKTPTAEVPVFIVPVADADQPTVVPFTVSFTTPDTATVSVFGDEKMRFRIDAAGHILSGASVRQHIVVLPSSATSVSSARAPNRNDVKSAEAIIKALYDANSVMVDQKRDADRFRSLFDANGRLISTNHGLVSASMYTRTVDEYVAAATSGRPRGGFSEREIARTAESFGSIMQVFSTYESRRDSTDTHPSRGINSIQLFNDGHRWWVVTVLWDTERANTPIPATYLKSGPIPP